MVASSYYFKLMVWGKKQQVNMYVLMSFDHIKYHNVSARLCSKENGGSPRF